MTRTTVDVDERALDAAPRELGTKGLSETVDAVLPDAARRRTLKGSTSSATSTAPHKR